MHAVATGSTMCSKLCVTIVVKEALYFVSDPSSHYLLIPHAIATDGARNAADATLASIGCTSLYRRMNFR